MDSLSTTKSKIVHPDEDARSIQWCTYAADGDRVKVAWGNAEGERGTYTAKCDGSLESSGSTNIRCWQAGSNVVEGEQLSDPKHRYYRRILSSNGKVMSIIWYDDASRRHATDRFVYTKN